jgi:hypothetical protein
VQARDEVIAAASTGAGHWSEHVQAQTDANRGKITATEMQRVFKSTRLAGPADVRRYEKAVSSDKNQTGACEAPPGTNEKLRAQFDSCAQRSKAQRPVLASGARVMADWKSHLGAMRMSRMGHVDDAQGVWLRAWRAAPPHISAHTSAASSYKDAPDC